MNRSNPARHRQRIITRSLRRTRQSSRPRYPRIQIDITVTLPRRLLWLLAGIAIGTLRLPDGMLQTANLLLRALLSR